MIYLILAIISSTSISVIMRLSEKRRTGESGILIFNYIVCTVSAVCFSSGKELNLSEPGLGFMLFAGALGGVIFMLSFGLFQKSISDNGLVLSSMFMKLGLIVPVLMAILAFGEVPGILQIIGLIIAFAVIIIVNFSKNSTSVRKNIFILPALLIMGGLSDSMVNIYDKMGNPIFSDLFLAMIFGVAGVCALLMLVVKKEAVGKWDIIFGLIIGVPNYFSSRFLLMALSDIPAVVAYPVYSVATLLSVSFIGIIVFKENLTGQKAIGFIMVIAALVMLQT